jgi:hypothetical protein
VKRVDHLLAALPARGPLSGCAPADPRAAAARPGWPAAAPADGRAFPARQRLERLQELVALALELVEALTDLLLDTVD